MEIFFSILFLLVTYFMTTLGLVQGYIPGGYKTIKEKNGKTYQVINYIRDFGYQFNNCHNILRNLFLLFHLSRLSVFIRILSYIF